MIKPNDVVYLSGKMTGAPDYNRPKFKQMELLIDSKVYNVYRKGTVVLNPARHPDGLTWEKYMQYAALDVENCTVMIQLDGWSFSRGAWEEFAMARKGGKRIITENELKVKYGW